MGILDILQGNDGAASPWGALYPSPLQNDPQQLAAIYAAAGMTPPQVDPFGDPSKSSVGPQPAPVTPPATGFGAGAAPFSFGGPGSNMVAPSQIAQSAPAPAASPAPSPVPAPVAPPAAAPVEQAEPIAVGNYQMPRIGAADDFEPDDETPAKSPTDVSAQSRQSPPGAPATAPFSLGGVASGIGDRLGLAGKGFLGNMAAGPIGALAGGLGALISGKPTDPGTISTQKQNLTAQALIAKGVPVADVQAAISNPDIMKTLITQYFGPDKFQHVTRKDALGGETIGAFDPTTGKTKFDDGGAGGAGGPQFGSLLAQGVTYDPNKTGDAYMAQFGPEVQAAAKAYIHGDVLPTGNARMNAIATFAKSVAQKWGQDTGVPVNDSTYSGKRTLANQLASSSNSSMGGILSNGESSFKHLADATESMAELGNASHDFPFGGMAAHAQNYIGNMAGGSNTKAKILATIDNLGKYGSESTKFYAGTGGGVEERTAARKDVDPNVVSGEEMAAFAAKEKSLMLDRLNTKFQEIRNTYGEAEGNAIIAKHMPDIQRNIATIDANVAKLRGQAAPAAAQGSAAVLPPGNYVWTAGTGVVGAK